MTKYQKGGLIAFVILAVCVVFALYSSDKSADKAEDVRIANEQNRYENCIVANNAIRQLNLQGSVQKDTLTLATEVAKEKGKAGDKEAAKRAERYADLNDKLHKSAELECIEP